MENEFDEVMLKRTDADLINILNSPAGNYQPLALNSAQREFECRNLSQEQISVASQVIQQKQQHDETQANGHLGVLAKIVALLFPGILLIVFLLHTKPRDTIAKPKS